MDSLPGYAIVIGVVVVAVVALVIFGTYKARRVASACIKNYRIEYMIEQDISNGREQHDLPAISYIRHDETPVDFHYVTDHVKIEPNIYPDTSLANMMACQCTGDCSDNCECARSSELERIYNEDGRLSDSYKLDAPEVIRECNVACKCNPRLCKNMVIQSGCQAKLVLFKTKTRGWGVRTLENLKRGTFVGVYSGELVPVVSSQTREDDTYLFNLSNRHEPQVSDEQPTRKTESNSEQGEAIVQSADDPKDIQPLRIRNNYVCDAKFFGNFTRFINHSCEPNVVGIRTFTAHQDNRFPHIAFFTNQDMKSGTELTLNYGDSYWLVKCKRDKVFCLCKRSKCKFNKDTLPITMEQYQNNKQ